MKNEFKTKELLNENIQTFIIGSWHIRVLPKEIVISGNEKSQLESMALFWSKSFNLKHKLKISGLALDGKKFFCSI